MFLLPGIVISAYATKTELPVEWKVEMTRYVANMQRDKGKDDQGWGLFVLFFPARRPSFLVTGKLTLDWYF